MSKEKEIYEMAKKFATVSVYPRFQKYDAQEVYESYGWIKACEELLRGIKEIEAKYEKMPEHEKLVEEFKTKSEELCNIRKELKKCHTQ